MSNHEYLSESSHSQPDQPNDELYIARMALVETIAAHASIRLRHQHPLIKFAAELIATDRVKSSLLLDIPPPPPPDTPPPPDAPY